VLTAYAMACAYRQTGKPEAAVKLFDRLRRLEMIPESLREDSALQHIELTLGWA